MSIFNRCTLVFLLIPLLAACNLATDTPPPTLEGSNSTVELIEQATNTPDALPTATTLIRPIPISQSIIGIVWQDVCDVRDRGDSIPLGCVVSDDSFRANGILEANETGIVGVYVTLGAGTCPAEDLAETVTDSDGSYTFRDLESGTYCVTINTLRPENLTLLAPGVWTVPSEDGTLTVTLGAGESKLDADFGWDLEFAP